MDSQVTEIIQESSQEIVRRYPIKMEAVGYGRDHIHLLCGAHPKVTPGRIIQILIKMVEMQYKNLQDFSIGPIIFLQI
jgi:REP element-mobilizing transposase RayT